MALAGLTQLRLLLQEAVSASWQPLILYEKKTLKYHTTHLRTKYRSSSKKATLLRGEMESAFGSNPTCQINIKELAWREQLRGRKKIPWYNRLVNKEVIH